VLSEVMKAYGEVGGRASRILNFGTRWRWGVSLKTRPFYPKRGVPATH